MAIKLIIGEAFYKLAQGSFFLLLLFSYPIFGTLLCENVRKNVSPSGYHRAQTTIAVHMSKAKTEIEALINIFSYQKEPTLLQRKSFFDGLENDEVIALENIFSVVGTEDCTLQKKILWSVLTSDEQLLKQALSHGAKIDYLYDKKDILNERYDGIIQQKDKSIAQKCSFLRASAFRSVEKLTALHIATIQRNFASVELLLRHGAQVNSRDTLGSTALQFAAENSLKNSKTMHHLLMKDRSLDIMTLLHNYNAFIDTKNDSCGDGPLHDAARECQVEAVKLLLSWGATVGLCNKKKRTPLHAAAWLSKEDADKKSYKKRVNEVVNILVSSGADVNAIDIFNRTALHRAANKGNLPAIRALLKKNARLDILDSNGLTALMDAQKNHRHHVISPLQEEHKEST